MSLETEGPDRGTVLIVDDEPVDRAELTAFLAGEGYRLLAATGGEEALRMTSLHEPDVILLDILMPDVSGLEVCRRVRASDWGVRCQIVLVTALTGEENLREGLEAGADDFIEKPVTPMELQARVRAHMRSKKRLDAVRRLDAARRLAEGRDRLVHLLAHDVRSPLTAALLGAELLELDLDDPEMRELTTTIAHEVKRVRSMIDGFLLVAKSEAGRLELSPRPVELRGLLRSVAEHARLIARDQGVRLEVEAGDEVVATADPELVTRAVDNLVSNGLKFSPRGGSVTVGLRRHGGSARIWVTDQGPGVPREQWDRIFEPFEGRGAPGESFGLGLVLVRQVCDAHRGRVWVDAAPGGGARFALEIPLGFAAHGSGGGPRLQPSQPCGGAEDGPSVLVVEGQP